MEFRRGDVVTAPSWGGDTDTIDYVKDLGLPTGPTAFFIGGGWWRANDLTLAFRPEQYEPKTEEAPR